MTEDVFTFTSVIYFYVAYSRVLLLFCLFLHVQFVNEEALACELAAYFYLEIGEVNKAVEYCLLAHEKYQEWVSISR